eukprot:TRINITY_DN1371_c1_g1_i1.p1 TRINITY_DN1371_c1_g1~~TRINITY_DN1371_c1_g1_i1.p1  ORF type:complete len:1309 (+),score=440.43 TRINITY_DN1371_c1_g1_i1:58-3984(+)
MSMAACTACGAPSVLGANFCHLCGSPVCVVPAVQMDLLQSSMWMGAQMMQALPPGLSVDGAAAAAGLPPLQPPPPSQPLLQQQRQQQQQQQQQQPRHAPGSPDGGQSRRERWTCRACGVSNPRKHLHFCSSCKAPRDGGLPQAKPPPRMPGQPPPQAPWLEWANKPCDGSIEVAEEVEAFAGFVSATSSERARRAAVRSALQKLAQLRVCSDATVKIIGGWATGLASFDSALDLVVEVPAGVDFGDPLAGFAAALSELEVHSLPVQAPGGAAIVFDAAALTSTELHVERSRGPAPASFLIYLYVAQRNSLLRAATQHVAHRLQRYPAHRHTLTVIRQVLRKLGTDISGKHIAQGISGFAVDLLALAFFESAKDSPSFSDPGWVLREFFRFYSQFDFANSSISSSPVFPPKVHTEDALSIVNPVDPGGGNVTPGPAKIAQLQATVRYMTMLIQRYDWDRRGSPLLPNLIPAKNLRRRQDWLRARDGVEMTKELAVAVAREVAEWLEDPANASQKADLLQQATWDTVQDLVRDQRLLRRVVTRGSALASYQEDIPKLVRVIDSFQSEPELKELYRRTGAASASPPVDPARPTVVVGTLQRAASAAADADKAAAARLVLSTGQLERPSDVALDFYSALLPDLESAQLSAFVAGLAAVPPESVRDPVAALLEATVDADAGVAMLEDVVRFLGDAENAERREALMKQAAAPKGYSRSSRESEAAVFAAVAESPTSVLTPFRCAPLQHVEYLDRFRGEPRFAEQIAEAALLGVTRDVALAIARDVADFLEDGANQGKKQELMKAALAPRDAAGQSQVLDTWITVFGVVAQRSKRLGPFRGNITRLVDLLSRFRGDPEIDAQRRRAARAVVTRDVAVAIARDLADYLEEQQPRGSAGEIGASVWENMESRVGASVLNRVARRMGLTAGSKHSPVPSELMQGMLAFQDEPELVALRKRAAVAGFWASHEGELSAISDRAFGERSPSPSKSPEGVAHSSPASPVRSAPSCAASSPQPLSAVSSDSQSHPPPFEGSFDDAAALVPCPPPADRPHFSSFDPFAQRAADTIAIRASIGQLYSALVDTNAFWAAHYAEKGCDDVDCTQWAHPGADRWGGVRAASYVTNTHMGRQLCNESHRYLLLKGQRGEVVLLLHVSSQMPDIPSGSDLRTETVFRFLVKSGEAVELTHWTTVQKSADLGMVAVMAQCMGEGVAAEVASAMVRLLPATEEASASLAPAAGQEFPTAVLNPSAKAFVPQQPPDWLCPRCGATNPQRHRHFCADCRSPRPSYLPPPSAFPTGGPPGGRFIRPPPGLSYGRA